MVDVVVGVVYNEDGRMLVNQRNYPKEFAGKWEFPGGKIEADETLHQALQRELMEEVNLKVISSEPLISITHRYTSGAVRLLVRKVLRYQGTARGREGQRIRWVDVDGLRDLDFLDANEAILNAVRLPHYYLLTNAAEFGCRHTIERLEILLQERKCIVQVREKNMNPQEFSDFAQAVISLCHSHGALVLANADPGIAVKHGFDGVHLDSLRLREAKSRPGPRDFWVAASCHDRGEIETAERLRADFIVLSPVAQTESHPQTAPLGWQCFRAYSTACSIPIYALGGLKFDDVAKAREAGAQGVALMRVAWRSD